jgi:hypothetical protein
MLAAKRAGDGADWPEGLSLGLTAEDKEDVTKLPWYLREVFSKRKAGGAPTR